MRTMAWRGAIVVILLLATGCAAAAYWWPFWRPSQTLELPGIVEIQEVRLGSKIGGRVAEVLVREGDVVESGQKLVRFDVPELEAQFQQQKGRVAAAEANLLKAKNGPREEEIRQTQSTLESQQADLEFAEDDYVRAEKLYKDKTFTRADFELAKAARNRARGNVASTRALLDMLHEGTREEDITLAEANVEEARGRLEELRSNLAEADVIAPERELVEVVSVRTGDLVPPNTPVIRVLRADDVWVKVYVPETDLGKVKLDQQVAVTCDAYPNRHFTGVVFQIASEAEFTPRNVQSLEERRYQVFGVKVRVDDPERVFKAGMSTTVVFQF